MAFQKKTWVDRLVEYAGRRKITNVSTGASQVVDVERSEGIVSQEGSAFSAANMNDLEQRIADEFNQVNSELDGVKFYRDINHLPNAASITSVRGMADAMYGNSMFFDFISIDARPNWGWPPTLTNGISITSIEKIGNYAEITVNHVPTGKVYRCMKFGEVWTDWKKLDDFRLRIVLDRDASLDVEEAIFKIVKDMYTKIENGGSCTFGAFCNWWFSGNAYTEDSYLWATFYCPELGKFYAVNFNNSSNSISINTLATKADIESIKTSFRAGCSTIAAAITAMGVATADNASPDTMAENIRKIKTTPTINSVAMTCPTGTSYIQCDLSGVSGYKNLVLYKNLFPVVTKWYNNHNGATGEITFAYNAATGLLKSSVPAQGAPTGGLAYYFL